jgi:hypothetical protein
MTIKRSEKGWGKVVVVSFKVLFWHLLGGTEETTNYFS